VRVHLCGVRGSTPAPGARFVRHGGHTSCVALAHDGATAPTLLLDAGTGIREVTTLTGGQPYRGSLLLGHLHWDHTQGLPFFQGGDHPDARVDVHVPAQEGRRARDLVAQSLSPPAFPITPEGLRGTWGFHLVDEGHQEVEGFGVLAREIPHKGGRTLGFRITDGTSTIAYLSDHHPYALGPGPDGFGPYHDAARELCDGVDLLLHDAQYTRAEWDARHHFGHATLDYAVGLAETCEVGRLLLFHHDPARTDDELDRIVAGLQAAAVPVDAAREGTTFDLAAPALAAPA
jgi:phosphoribosyl 1,2-cyclic phosphodiesterase